MFSIRCTPTFFGLMTSSGITSFSSTTATVNVTSSSAATYEAIITSSVGSNSHVVNSGSYELAERMEDVLNTNVIGTVCVLGLLGNMLNLLVLTHRSLKTSMERLERSAHRGMVALATSDLCLCLVLLPHAFVDRNVADARSVTFELVYTVYGVGVINTFMMTSTWLTVYMALSRYLAIVHPLLARRLLGGTTFTYLSFTFIFLCSVAFNVPRFLLYTIVPLNCLEGYQIFFRCPGNYLSIGFQATYSWAYFACAIWVPLVTLTYCNVHLIRALRHASVLRLQLTRSAAKKAENMNVLTLTFIIIVVLYVMFVMPAEIIHFVQAKVQQNWSTKPLVNLAIAVVNAMQAATFSVNFLLYCVINVRFRRTCHALLLCRPCMRRRRGRPSFVRHHIGGGTGVDADWAYNDETFELVTTTTAIVCSARSPRISPISSRKRPSSHYGRTHV